jgi:hypothetical protein
MPAEGLPREALEASVDGSIVDTGAVNGTEPDVVDDQPQTRDPIEGAPA